MYLFYAWLIKNQLFTLEQTWQVALCVYAWNILLAYLCLKWYDEPIRKYLAKRFLEEKMIVYNRVEGVFLKRSAFF